MSESGDEQIKRWHGQHVWDGPTRIIMSVNVKTCSACRCDESDYDLPCIDAYGQRRYYASSPLQDRQP
jgi:hypothetical protein